MIAAFQPGVWLSSEQEKDKVQCVQVTLIPLCLRHTCIVRVTGDEGLLTMLRVMVVVIVSSRHPFSS